MERESQHARVAWWSAGSGTKAEETKAGGQDTCQRPLVVFWERSRQLSPPGGPSVLRDPGRLAERVAQIAPMYAARTQWRLLTAFADVRRIGGMWWHWAYNSTRCYCRTRTPDCLPVCLVPVLSCDLLRGLREPVFSRISSTSQIFGLSESCRQSPRRHTLDGNLAIMVSESPPVVRLARPGWNHCHLVAVSTTTSQARPGAVKSLQAHQCARVP